MSVSVSYCNTLNAHFDYNRPVCFSVNLYIAEVIIGDILFHQDEVEGVTRAQALALFKPVPDELSHEESAHVPNDAYISEVKTTKRFILVSRFIYCAALF